MNSLYSVLYDDGSGRGMGPSGQEVFHTRSSTPEAAIRKVMKHQGWKEIPNIAIDHLANGDLEYYYDGSTWTASVVKELP